MVCEHYFQENYCLTFSLWVFGLDSNLSFKINASCCFLEFPRKLPRAKPCSDPNRVREPGEVEFDIEVGTFPLSSLLLILVKEIEDRLLVSLGWIENILCVEFLECLLRKRLFV